jgi:hypothetical protein
VQPALAATPAGQKVLFTFSKSYTPHNNGACTPAILFSCLCKTPFLPKHDFQLSSNQRLQIMKPLLLLSTTAMICLLAPANAQNNLENEIRKLDKAEAQAVLQHDTLMLETLWADDFTVNTPLNTVNTRKRGDRINLYYNRFDRNTEKLMVYNDSLAITMGSEIINRKPPMTMPGQTLTRRYTHVWMKRNGRWQLAARHANFICPDMPQQQLK